METGPRPGAPCRRTNSRTGACEMTASERITDEVTSWEGVQSGYGRRGEFAFKVRGKEIGHLHGDHAAHFFFPADVWSGLIKEGRIGPHPVFPNRRGPAARWIDGAEDV